MQAKTMAEHFKKRETANLEQISTLKQQLEDQAYRSVRPPNSARSEKSIKPIIEGDEKNEDKRFPSLGD